MDNIGDGTFNHSIRNRMNSKRNNSIFNEKRLSLVRLVNDQGHSIKEAASLLEIDYINEF